MQKKHEKQTSFPSCIKDSLHRAESTISDDLQGYVLSGENCQVVFWEVKNAFYVEEHSHPHAEWGIVVTGSCELGLEGELKTYHAGESFYVPPGMAHTSKMSDDYRAIDFFNTGDWIKTK